ncbi:MAG: ribonuclease PH [Planctomycetota bacterium]
MAAATPYTRTGREHDAIRPVTVRPDPIEEIRTAVIYCSGKTQVLCVATMESGTPPWLNDNQGWLTAEYSLMPFAVRPRATRARDGKIDGRSQEIQRLIGRSLRASVDRNRFPGYTIRLDCDVLHADGGTRTAAITGAGIALGYLVRDGLTAGTLAEDPRVASVAAISVGLIHGAPHLDLDYREDSRAEIDLNLVGTPDGKIIEVQGASESDPIERATWEELLQLGCQGLEAVGAVASTHGFPIQG